jgi:hypothetical protein
MLGKLPRLVLVSATIAAVVLSSSRCLGDNTERVQSTLLALGPFGEIDISNLFPRGLSRRRPARPTYTYRQRLVARRNKGRHSHPGGSLINVTAGIVTDYEGRDPRCKPHVYTTGS